MNQIRLLNGAGLAFLVTASLFILMPTLIQIADPGIGERERHRLADIHMPEREIETRRDERPERPPEPEQPPPDLQPQQMEDFNPNLDAVNMSPSMAVGLDVRGGGLSASDGEYLPIVRVAPIYPRRAQSRGIEGYCTVQFTVTRTGTTKDIEAIDCTPPGYFETSSIRAAERFKYRPRVVDGDPVEVPGVQNRFTYELEQ